MNIVYENKKYTFRNKWLSEGEREVSNILSNFLSERAIQDGADPELFKDIITSAKSKVKISNQNPEKNSSEPDEEILFDLSI